jgi:hypothetical protein
MNALNFTELDFLCQKEASLSMIIFDYPSLDFILPQHIRFPFPFIISLWPLDRSINYQLDYL